MSRIKVINTLRIYETDGKETPVNRNDEMKVESHWNMRDRIVLIIDGKKYTVIARDIQAAIANATNTAGF